MIIVTVYIIGHNEKNSHIYVLLISFSVFSFYPVLAGNNLFH